MYQEFYGLRENPFALTPDPLFLYLSESHRTAIESLLCGIKERWGFMVLTGDIGTGKTTVCRALLGKLGPQVRTAVIFNSWVSEGDLLKSILLDFGLPSARVSKKDRMDCLNKFLIHLLSQGENAVLIIDEAQNLPVSVLEQIRMLSNLETEKEKMLQIILIGQLELGQKLQSPALKQLNQRVAVRYCLRPLTRRETELYVEHRLTVAGACGGIHFAGSAFDEIYRFSRGVPRLTNLLCHRSLLAGFVEETNYINEKTVRKARTSLLEDEKGLAPLPFWSLCRKTLPLYIVFFILVTSFFAGLLFSSPDAKKYIGGKIQKAYYQLSLALEKSALKIQVHESLRESREAPPKGESQ